MFFAEFWQCLRLIQQASALPSTQHIYICVFVVIALRTMLGSLKEERKKNNLRRQRFGLLL